jgi:hypothetical protein
VPAAWCREPTRVQLEERRFRFGLNEGRHVMGGIGCSGSTPQPNELSREVAGHVPDFTQPGREWVASMFLRHEPDDT